MDNEKVVTEPVDKEESTAFSLQDIFPGETYGLKAGKIVLVRKWSARQVTREIPAIFARLFSKIVRSEDALPIEERMILALQSSTEDILDLVKITTGVTEEDLDRMAAAELIALVRAMVRQNQDFFAEAQGLYQDIAKKDVSSED